MMNQRAGMMKRQGKSKKCTCAHFDPYPSPNGDATKIQIIEYSYCHFTAGTMLNHLKKFEQVYM